MDIETLRRPAGLEGATDNAGNERAGHAQVLDVVVVAEEPCQGAQRFHHGFRLQMVEVVSRLLV
jgi:hypothetical protein